MRFHPPVPHDLPALALATAAGAVGHGYATLLRDGSLGDDPGAPTRAADAAGRAARALLRGRRELDAGSGPGPAAD